MTRSWYAFIGGSDPVNVKSYIRLTIKHQCLCGQQICAIYAKGDDLYPEWPLSTNLQHYIKDALATGQLQPQMPFNAKKFVYLKY